MNAFERRRGISLPSQYRDFLLRDNGGKPDPNFFIVKRDDGTSQLTWLRELKQLGLLADDYKSLDYMPDYYEEDIPLGALVIGNAMSNDVVLVFVDGPRVGQVWYKCFLRCVEEGNPEEELHFLAASFSEFLQLLIPNPTTRDRADEQRST